MHSRGQSRTAQRSATYTPNVRQFQKHVMQDVATLHPKHCRIGSPLLVLSSQSFKLASWVRCLVCGRSGRSIVGIEISTVSVHGKPRISDERVHGPETICRPQDHKLVLGEVDEAPPIERTDGQLPRRSDTPGRDGLLLWVSTKRSKPKPLRPASKSVRSSTRLTHLWRALKTHSNQRPRVAHNRPLKKRHRANSRPFSLSCYTSCR